MSPKQARGADTVERVLDAALALHASQGHGGLTMSALIAKTGISSGSIYHHFGSLDGLCAALYARCMAALLDEIITGLEGAGTARGGVEALVHAYLGFTRDQRAAAYFIHASSYAGFLPAHRHRVAEAKQPRMARINAWLRRHVQSGEVLALPEPLTEMLVIGPVAET
ncbi:TetR/AcrR family transcriptional regulator, partial [Actinomadura adrarensis]